ncbi:hypothetical protein RhiirB3_393587 [Rhizophagus irregularis]|nr:hypothetical protein RhiirB3_393587 [Rhizophagus irregularis]
MDGMIDLLIGSEISRINKGKGRAIKIESNEFNDEQEEEEETKSDDEQEIGDEQAEMNFYQINKQVTAPKDKPRISDDFDKLVCAEIPDEQQQPLLYETVSRGRAISYEAIHTINGIVYNTFEEAV